MVHRAKTVALKISLFSLQIGMAAALCLMSSVQWSVAIEETQKTIDVELNAAQQVGDKCRLVFVVENDLEADIENLSLETVLFDKEGVFSRLTLFDFKAVPAGKPRVRQFMLPKTNCDDLGRLLINGVSVCEMASTKSDACEKALQLKSRTPVELIG